ncbi:putative galactose oxidase/kelch, beta-propeller, F-box associated interaction [Arabidopsis thaliana]
MDVTGEFSIINSHSYLNLADIEEVLHYDGLLLCTIMRGCPRLVVWNPCTGQTKWIQINSSCYYGYALGSWQDKESGNNNSYKILSYNYFDIHKQKIAICDMKSNSWRNLDVTPDCRLVNASLYSVSLKGRTYWFVAPLTTYLSEETHFGLVSFDYKTERFERMCLPSCHIATMLGTLALSVVKEEKLIVLLHGANTSKTEIWLTNKIDETKVVSWSMILAMDHLEFDIWSNVRLIFDEEKRFGVCCNRKRRVKNGKIHCECIVHIIEEDNKVTKVDFAASKLSYLPLLFNYVPSLVQIQ